MARQKTTVEWLLSSRRSRSKSKAQAKVVMWGLAAFCVYAAFQSLVKAISDAEPVWLIAFVCGFACMSMLVVWQRRQVKAANSEAIVAAVNEALKKHARALASERVKLVRVDAYGLTDESRWWPELTRFVQQIIYNPLSIDLQHQFNKQRSEILASLDAYIVSLNEKNSAVRDFSRTMSPSEFEQFCASELRRAGWSTRLTKGSGDQGVDVIAERQGIVLAVQCKLYSRTVGNKAVMEVAAGRDHERAHYAAVCSNQGYSSHAKDLARTNGVLLLHYGELADLHLRLTSRV